VKAPAELERYDIYRPVGHDDALAAFENAILAAADDASVPLAHALVIAGPAGVGKFLAALWLGSRLKCASPSTCVGDCPACKKIRVGTHLDFYVIDPVTAGRNLIGISDITGKLKAHHKEPMNPPGLIQRMSKRASEPGPVVAIVRDAQLMNLEAQSALLKTLEEPPGAALIILVTDSLSALMPTVRSRCQLLRLGQLDDATIEQILTDRGISETQAHSATHLAAGSPGRAFSTTPDLLEARDELLIDFELCCVRRFDMDALVKRLADNKKAADKPGLEVLYEWQMKKVETALGYTHTEASDKLSGLLAKLAAADDAKRSRLLREAERTHTTITSMSRNANAKLAIRDMLLAARHS
jgi:DNA polymerase-3 subunit delta'